MGAAFSHGFDFGGDIAAAQKQRKQAISDMELESNIGQANDNVNGFRAKLSQYAPGSPEHEQAKQGLAEALQARTQLFHPANNPTAMGKFGHMLLDHIPGRQPSAPPAGPPTTASAPAIQLPSQIPPTNGTGASSFTLPGGAGPVIPAGPAATVQGPQTPQTLKAQAEANLIASAAPTPPPGSLTPEETHSAELVKSGLQPRAVAPKAATAASAKAVQWLTDGEGKAHPFELVDGKFQPVEGADGMTPPVKQAPHSNAALQTFIRTKYGDTPTAEQYEEGITEFKRLQTPDTTGTHEAIVYDQDGNAHKVTEASSSHKSFGHSGGGSSPAGSSSKPGTKKTAPKSPVSDVLPGIHKNTPAQSKAQTDLVSATKLASFADQVAADPNASPSEQKQVALRLIKDAAGRVNMQEYDVMTKRAGLANTLVQWANNVTTGKLPNDVFSALVAATHKNLKSAQDARDTAYGTPYTPGELKGKAKANTQAMSDDEFLLNLGKK